LNKLSGKRKMISCFHYFPIDVFWSSNFGNNISDLRAAQEQSSRRESGKERESKMEFCNKQEEYLNTYLTQVVVLLVSIDLEILS
jgi:hypothetical protein